MFLFLQNFSLPRAKFVFTPWCKQQRRVEIRTKFMVQTRNIQLKFYTKTTSPPCSVITSSYSYKFYKLRLVFSKLTWYLTLYKESRISSLPFTKTCTVFKTSKDSGVIIYKSCLTVSIFLTMPTVKDDKNMVKWQRGFKKQNTFTRCE